MATHEESERHASCARGDLHRPEFRGEGSLLSSKPDGLIRTDRSKRAMSLLPFLDCEQTHKVIHAIENRFPGLAEGWRSGQAPNGHAALGSVKQIWSGMGVLRSL